MPVTRGKVMKMENNKYLEWASSFLVANGYTIQNAPKLVQSTPWSTVWRFETGMGFIYLKRSIQEFFIETNIIRLIDTLIHDCVPKVLTVNLDLNCFLMQDAGVTLREIFKYKFDADLLEEAIKKYTAIQSTMSAKIDALLDLGVLDWRLNKIPDMYSQLIANDELLDEIGILPSEKAELQVLKSKLSDICDRLTSYKIPQTLDHSDFHDNNILIDEKNNHITIIDLGEVVVSHPFFSLHSCLFYAQYCNYFNKDDQNYLKIKNACLHNFMRFESEDKLLDIFDITYMLHPLYYIFTVMRLITICDKRGFRTDFTGPDGIIKTLNSQKNNIAGCFRRFILMLTEGKH